MMSKTVDVCKTLVIHKDLVLKASSSMPNDNLIRVISDFFKVLSDATRLKIINALFYSEMCVCDLSAVLKMKLPAISHQLKTLKQANFVKHRREGKTVYYSLTDEHVKQIYQQGLLHVNEKKEEVYE